MAKTPCKEKSLAGKIFLNLLVFTLGMVVLLAVTMTVIYYSSYEHEAEVKLTSSAQAVAHTLNSSPSSAATALLQHQISGSIRYTLIDSGGTVLFDSAADAAHMENHANRPEVRGARQSGQADTIRRSATLRTDTIYAAIRLDDGRVIRLSETRRSLLAFLGGMLVPVLVALVVCALLVFFLSKMLTKHIMKPIDALDFSYPLNNKIYPEMNPLLTKIHDQQDQLIKQNQHLAEAETMRRDFSSNVSHEMKTPLQVISGYAELMKNDMVLPDDREKIASLIYGEAQALRLLINDVLTLSKLDEAAFGAEGFAPVNLRAVGERVAHRLASFAGIHQVSVSVQGQAVWIAGNELLAEEMLYNLIENGIRYNHPGGVVYLSTALCAGEVEVCVKDSGPGIPEDMRDKVFERFFRVDKSRSKETGGTGLGLAIVKHAVAHHKGSIEVRGGRGEGTTFVLHFPPDQSKHTDTPDDFSLT